MTAVAGYVRRKQIGWVQLLLKNYSIRFRHTGVSGMRFKDWGADGDDDGDSTRVRGRITQEGKQSVCEVQR